MYYRTFLKNSNDFKKLTIEMLYNHIAIETATLASETIEAKVTAAINKPITKDLVCVPSRVAEHTPVYTEFRIPKASGGFRKITEPDPTTKALQKELLTHLCFEGATATDAAFAYTKGRTHRDALIRHQLANNKWFYKFDIKDFFPNCTKEILMSTLPQIYPFCKMSEEQLELLMHLALYENALPQGSSLSPLLSNMLMTPFDYTLTFAVKKLGGTYTRYADDILISFPTKHELAYVERLVNNHLHRNLGNTFRLNSSKSRCGSIAGSNWNLGLMLNKDNQITIGHKKKLQLKAKLNNFIWDFTKGNYWSIIDTQSLQGELNYFKTVEPDYAIFVMHRLETKYNTMPVQQMFSDIISGRVCR